MLGQEVKLYYTASDIVTLCRWPSGAQWSVAKIALVVFDGN